MSKLVLVASLLWLAGAPQIAPFFGVGRGSIKPILERIYPLLAMPMRLTRHEFDDPVSFVGQRLLDRRASSQNLCRSVRESLPTTCHRWCSRAAEGSWRPGHGACEAARAGASPQHNDGRTIGHASS